MLPPSAYGSRERRLTLHGVERHSLHEFRHGEFDFVSAMARSLGADLVIADLATNGLRAPIMLQERGIGSVIYAIDISPKVFELAARLGVQERLSADAKKRIVPMVADMCYFSLPELADLIMVLFTSFWYNFGVLESDINAELRGRNKYEVRAVKFLHGETCLQAILRNLKQGGVFLIDNPIFYIRTDFELDYTGRMWESYFSLFWWSIMALKLNFSFVIVPYSYNSYFQEKVLIGKKL